MTTIMMFINRFKIAVLLFFVLLCPANAKDNFSVVTTIRPLHSIVANIMSDVGYPRLLLKHQQDAHHANLKPSQLRELINSSLVFRISRDLESFLNPVFKSPGIQEKVHTASNFHNITKLTYPNGAPDPHIWLSSKNALAIATAISKILINVDLENSASYKRNLIRFEEEIKRLQAEISEFMRSAGSRRYLVDHDALQYFANEFNLQIRTIGNRNDELTPSAKQIVEARNIVGSGNYDCIIVGNETNSVAIQSIAHDASIPILVLDPTGSNINPGPQQYFQLMRNIATGIAACG